MNLIRFPKYKIISFSEAFIMILLEMIMTRDYDHVKIKKSPSTPYDWHILSLNGIVFFPSLV